MSKKLELKGKVFGRFTVISESGKNKQCFITWLCRCECGNKKIVAGYSLKRGRSQSCGCLRDERTRKGSTTHGLTNHTLYHTWLGMRKRCNNKNNIGYPLYGGRGITVCKRWDDFELFLSDMGNKPFGTSLDRIDNNKGYNPKNCKWSTITEQQRNTSTNRMITYKGKTLCIAEWAEKLGIKYSVFYNRLRKNNDIKKALININKNK